MEAKEIKAKIYDLYMIIKEAQAGIRKLEVKLKEAEDGLGQENESD